MLIKVCYYVSMEGMRMSQSILNETSRALKQRYLSNKEVFDNKAKILRKKNDEMFSQFMVAQATRLLVDKLLDCQHEQAHFEKEKADPYIDFDVSLKTDDDTKNFSLQIEINEPFFKEEDVYLDLPNSDRLMAGSKNAPLFILK